MAKKRLEPYVCPDKPAYADIKWGGKTLKELGIEYINSPEFLGDEKGAIKKAREVSKSTPKNKWTPNIVLDPWLHYDSFTLRMFKDSRGYGPGWTNPYTLKEFLINWIERRLTFKEMVDKYSNPWLSERQIRTLIEYIREARVTSPLLHFTSMLLDNNTKIVKPDFFVPNPFPPNEYGSIKASYAFYKVPNFVGKDYGNFKDGSIYVCPQLMQKLIIGNVLEQFMKEDFTEEYEMFKEHPQEPYDTLSLNITNYDQFRYYQLLLLFSTNISNSWADKDTGFPKSYSYSELFITKDVNVPGQEEFTRTSCIDLYNQVWIEELIKRTMWDQITEHSLCMFSDAIHDGARQHVDNNGRILRGHHPDTYKRDYFSMPFKVRPFLHNIGVKPPGKTRGCTPEFHRFYPDTIVDGKRIPGKSGDLIYPIFDYVFRYDKQKECVVPFNDKHCKYKKLYLMANGVRTLHHQYEANGGKLRLTQDELDTLNVWAKKTQL